MRNSLSTRVETCLREGLSPLLRASNQAIEREGLRVQQTGHLARSPHPTSLGAALTHDFVITDYSEAQLELVTPPFPSSGEVLHFLRQLHAYILSHLGEERLWPCSTPCILPKEAEIPIAEFGDSPEGRAKHLYRVGLGNRYGRQMQMLCGVHYNFSVDPTFWEQDGLDFGGRTDAYLALARNFLRHSWLNTYLFGASPAAHESFFPEDLPGLERGANGTLYAPEGTSLRMSPVGYYGRCQQEVRISYDTLPDYLRDLRQALESPQEEFVRMGIWRDGEQVQLNDRVLQVEAEHYAEMRPKPLLNGERPVAALERGGVVYVEARSVDVNPFAVEGIDRDQMNFLHLFMLYNLFKSSPPQGPQEREEQQENQRRVAIRGRGPGLKLLRGGQEVLMQDWAEEILDEMCLVAELLDGPEEDQVFVRNVARQRERLSFPEKTLSGRLLCDLQTHNRDWIQLGLSLAQQYRATLMSQPFDPLLFQNLQTAGQRSLQRLDALESQPQS